MKALNSAAVQRDSDAQLRDAILVGHDAYIVQQVAPAKDSRTMPVFSQILRKDDVRAIIQHVRSFAR
jgi:hypothetical protein